MISQRSRGLQNTLLLCQALLVVLALWVSMLITFQFFTEASRLHFDRYPLYGAILILGLLFESMSRDRQNAAANLFRPNFFEQHAVSVRQTLFASGTLFLYLAAAKDAFISRTVLAILVPQLYFLFLGTNVFLPRLLARRVFGEDRIERALLVGPARDALRLQSWLREKEAFAFRAVGLLTSEEDASVPGLPRLGSCSDLERVLSEQRITQVILLELPASPEDHEELVGILEGHGSRLLILSNLEEKLRHRVIHLQEGGLEFIAPRIEPLEDPLNRGLKRLLDLLVAIPITVFILPPMSVVVWLLHRLQSPGPIFYRQVRNGIQNRQFTIVKFRTMHMNNPVESRQASRDDARIFPAGHWLRRMSLDEIPQFLNVITGEMSVCGPRPHLPQHNADFARKMRRYHLRAFIKPGITGLAQVRGFRGEVKSLADIEQRIESDIAYFENWRLSLDLAIIFRTGLQIFLFACNGLLRGSKAAGTPSVSTCALPMQNEHPFEPAGRTYVPEAVRRNFRQILGIRFFTGSAEEAVALGMRGGLVVAPSAPVLLGLEDDPVHRAAVRGSALAITDSGLMVLLWKLLTGEDATRVSGLRYLKLLLDQPQLRAPGATFWVMPSESAMAHNLAWLQERGFPVTRDDCYVAPEYSRSIGERITDPRLVELIQSRRPAHIIMAVGGGVQEKLGAGLLNLLDYRPAVHCTGAAVGFLSGEQAGIPMWADRCRLGWLVRCLDEPAKFVPRYWQARKLISLMFHYHGRLPDGAPPSHEPANVGAGSLPSPSPGT
jgi:exopolysaccharide biosynthesis polyprenyl glycosylphosphotransferase